MYLLITFHDGEILRLNNLTQGAANRLITWMSETGPVDGNLRICCASETAEEAGQDAEKRVHQNRRTA